LVDKVVRRRRRRFVTEKPNKSRIPSSDVLMGPAENPSSCKIVVEDVDMSPTDILTNQSHHIDSECSIDIDMIEIKKAEQETDPKSTRVSSIHPGDIDMEAAMEKPPTIGATSTQAADTGNSAAAPMVGIASGSNSAVGDVKMKTVTSEHTGDKRKKCATVKHAGKAPRCTKLDLVGDGTSVKAPVAKRIPTTKEEKEKERRVAKEAMDRRFKDYEDFEKMEAAKQAKIKSKGRKIEAKAKRDAGRIARGSK
jgi:hypothetical protein